MDRASCTILPHFLGWSTYFNRYIAVGASVSSGGGEEPGMSFALSDDLIEWDSPTLLRMDNTSAHVKEAYAALLDEWASAGRGNMDRVGQNTSFLYYMHSYPCNLTSFNCRDIWRQSVSFGGASTTTHARTHDNG